MNLYERMLRVLEMRQWSTRDWARAAGLREESHVSTIMARLRRDTHRTVSSRTLTALARGAGVSHEWLSTGRGSPTGQHILIEPDPDYPTRAQAVAAARLLGRDSRAIERVQKIDDLAYDPGLDYWFRRIETEHLRILEGSLRRSPDPATAPVAPSDGPPQGKRPARRKGG